MIEPRPPLNDYVAAVDGLASADDLAAAALPALLARDALLRDGARPLQTDAVQRLVEADGALRALGPRIAALPEYAGWRSALPVDPGAWWWQFEPAPEPAARWDWVFNAGTAALLAFAASLSVGVVRALSTSGISAEEALGTLLHGLVIAVIGQGAFSEQGRDKVAAALGEVGVPRRVQAAATFAAAASLALLSYGLHDIVLPQAFRSRGESALEHGHHARARDSFTRALALLPDDPALHLALGQVYERLDSLDAAGTHYNDALLGGETRAFAALGRVLLLQTFAEGAHGDLYRAEALLRLGLQHAYLAPHRDEAWRALVAGLHRDLGWALAEQARAASDPQARLALVDEAREQLQQAGLHDREHPHPTGFWRCVLADLQEVAGEDGEATWGACARQARPTTLAQMRWLAQSGRGAWAQCMDSNRLVALPGGPGQPGQVQDSAELCGAPAGRSAPARTAAVEP